MSVHRVVCLMVVFISCALSGSCSRTDEPTSAETPAPEEPTVVTVSYLPYLAFGPLFIGQEEGYFAEEGIEIEFVPLKRSVLGTAPLADGKLDVLGGGTNAAFFNAIARGADIRIVADKGHIGDGPPPVSAFLIRPEVLENNDLTDPADWKKLRIAMSRDNFEGFFLSGIINPLGLTLEDLNILDLPPPALNDGLAKGTLDMTQATEPWITRLLDGGHVTVWKSACAVMPGNQYAFIAYGPSLLRDRPEVGQAFMVAYLRGARQFAEGATERNVEIMAKHTQLPPGILERTRWAPMRPDGSVDTASLDAFNRWAVETGYMDRALVASEFWEPAFVEEAVRRLDGGARAAGNSHDR